LRHRPGALGALIALAVGGTLVAAAVASPPTDEPQDLVVKVTGLRNGKGQVLACLVTEAKAFPDCKGKVGTRHMSASAAKGEIVLDFGAVPPGTYALSLFHDENGNGKLDTAMMIPREGYAFSRDAPVRLGPPSFDQAAFAVGAGTTRQTVKMRYLL
jgi:uncharacterized protein (DUF2141 family)